MIIYQIHYWLCITILVTSSWINTETLFYKENNTPILESEHTQLYTIMMQHQFPTSTLYGNNADDEINTIQSTLDAQLPGIKVMFIPTTIYELLFLHFVETHKKNIAQASGNLLYDDPNKPYVEQKKSMLLAFFDPDELLDFHAINNAEELKKCHLLFNNYILDYIHANISKTVQTITPDDFIDLIKKADFIDTARKQLSTSYPGGPFDTRYETNTLPLPTALLQKIIILEYWAHEQKMWLLYRGTCSAETLPEIDTPVSLSLSNTCFAGILFDRGASAFHHYTNFSSNNINKSYILPISKKKYIQEKLACMFHIPPLITLAGMLAKGEFFHSRTKVPDLDTKPLGFMSPIKTEKIPDFYLTSKDPVEAIEIYHSIFTYIKTHRILFDIPPLP